MANKKVEDYLNLSYQKIVQEDEYSNGGKYYRAFCPELPGCASHGDTVEEAVESLQEAMSLYIETLISNNQTVPVPIEEKTVFTSLMGNADITSIILQKRQNRHEIEEKKIQDWILTPTV